MKPIKSFYQPSGLMWIISWSWVAAIGLISLIIQLEITHFNFWTGLTLLIFIIAICLSIVRRRVYLLDDRLFIGRIFYHYDSVDLNEITSYQIGKQNQVMLVFNGQEHSYLFEKKFRTQLQQSLINNELERD